MIQHNARNKIKKKIIYFYLYHGVLEYNLYKNNSYNCVFKNINMF